VRSLVAELPDKKFAPYQRMANAIIDLTREHGRCLPQDLLTRGFTYQETTEIWHMANAMAEVEMRLGEGRVARG